MSNASDRNFKAEDPSSFAPKWARDPSLRDRRPDAPRLPDAARLGGGDAADDASNNPPAPSAMRRGAEIADLRAPRLASSCKVVPASPFK